MLYELEDEVCMLGDVVGVVLLLLSQRNMLPARIIHPSVMYGDQR
jgi:hypothetical protein